MMSKEIRERVWGKIGVGETTKEHKEHVLTPKF